MCAASPLLSLGVTCWPDVPALHGIFLYNVAVTAYLTYLTVGGEYRGILLVSVVILHSVLTVVLLWRSYRAPAKRSGLCIDKAS